MNRYRSDRRIRGGKLLATNTSIRNIRNGVRSGRIKTRFVRTKEGERLDIIAAKYLGDARLWWIVAACSGVGWAMQVPPGTVLNIPVNIAEISALI